MNNIIHEIRKSYTRLIKMLDYISKQLNEAPQGYLKISKRGKRNSYYQMIKPAKVGEKQKCHYLSKKKPEEENIIKALAQKQYYQQLLPILQNEINVMEHMLKYYRPNEKYDLFHKLPDTRQQLVTPSFKTPAEEVKAWEKEEWKPYDKYPEDLKYETNRGIVVRSKSEMFIAETLDLYSDYLAYRYEDELYLEKTRTLLHPEFTIRKRSNGKRYFWEHFGRMHDLAYVDDFIDKINKYIMEGIYPGEQLIITFESPDKTIDTNVVRKLIKHYFVET